MELYHLAPPSLTLTGSRSCTYFLTGPYVANPWSPAVTEDLDPDRPVVILGTGLSMVDITMQLWASGFPGPVIAISRRALLPQGHVLTASWPTPAFSAAERRSLARLTRRNSAGGREGAGPRRRVWQSVVDSLRPITAQLRQCLPEAEQRRFLRHGRPWWDAHRHRMAPLVAHQTAGLVRQGYLQIRAGHVTGIEASGRLARVSYRPRGGSDTVSCSDAQRVIEARGATAVGEAQDPLIGRLLGRGLVRLDRHRLGLDVTPDLQAIGASGTGHARPVGARSPGSRGVLGVYGRAGYPASGRSVGRALGGSLQRPRLRPRVLTDPAAWPAGQALGWDTVAVVNLEHSRVRHLLSEPI